MSSAEYTGNDAAFSQQYEQMVVAPTRALAEEVQSRAKQIESSTRSQWYTGRLNASIQVTQSRTSLGRFATGFEVGTDLDYAQYSLYGTRTPIRSRSGKRMPVGKRSGDIVAYKHQVRGQKAKNFLVKAYNEVTL